MQAIGTNLRRLRVRAGLTQDALAGMLHVTRQTVSSWEIGRTEPDLDTLLALAEALHCDATELIYGVKRNGYQQYQRRWIVCSMVCGAVLLAAGLAAGARPGAGGAARHDVQSGLQHLPALRVAARVLYGRHSAVRAGIRLAAGPGRRKGSPVAAGCRDPLCPAAVGAGRNCAVCPARRKYPAAGHPPVLSRRRSAPRPLPDPAARAVHGRGLRVFGVEAVTKLLPPHQSALRLTASPHRGSLWCSTPMPSSRGRHWVRANTENFSAKRCSLTNPGCTFY